MQRHRPDCGREANFRPYREHFNAVFDLARPYNSFWGSKMLQSPLGHYIDADGLFRRDLDAAFRIWRG